MEHTPLKVVQATEPHLQLDRILKTGSKRDRVAIQCILRTLCKDKPSPPPEKGAAR